MSTGRWRGWLAAAGLLIFGIALGSAGTTWLGGRMVREALQGGAETGLADRAAVRIGADLAKKLKLTPAEGGAGTGRHPGIAGTARDQPARRGGVAARKAHGVSPVVPPAIRAPRLPGVAIRPG